MKNLLSPLFFFLALHSQSFSQNIAGTTHYPFANWLWYYDLHQSADGNIWVGGQLGKLARYNGSVWTAIDVPGASDADIRAIATAAGNKIWLGTDKAGLFYFNGIAWNHFTRSNSKLPNDAVQDIEVDANGVVWVATLEGLVSIDSSAWTVFTKDNSTLPNNFVYAIARQGNTLWLGMSDFLVRKTGMTFTKFSAGNLLASSPALYELAVAPNGNIWVGAGFSGMACFNPATVSWLGLPTALSSVYVQVVGADAKSNLWYGEANFGLHVYNGADIANYEAGSTIVPSGQLTDILPAQNGRLWVCGLGGGVIEITDWSFTSVGLSEAGENPMQLSPSVSADAVYLRFAGADGATELLVFAPDGSLISHIQPRQALSEYRLDVSQLPVGMYLVQATVAGRTCLQKFAVKHP